MTQTVTVNPFLHLNSVTIKWVIDEDANTDHMAPELQAELEDQDAFGCRVRANVLVEGVAGTQSYEDNFDLEASLWGIYGPEESYREEVEEELLDELKSRLEKVGIDTTNFNERRELDHFNKPIRKPNGSCF